MQFNSVEDVTKVLLKQVLENGESIWEEFEGAFHNKQNEYLEFLVKKGHITEEQKENWLKVYKEIYNNYDGCGEYDHIEAMTYTSPVEFPMDIVDKYELDEDSDECSINIEKATELNLINVPVFIKTTDVEEYNKIYWETVIPIIAEYLFENLDNEKYVKVLQDI